MTPIFLILLASTLVASNDLFNKLDNRSFVVGGCATKNASIFVVLALDGEQHSVLEVANFKNKTIITRSEVFEMSTNGKPHAVEFSAGIASENELAFYRDYLLSKQLNFVYGYEWAKIPNKINCPIYQYPYN